MLCICLAYAVIACGAEPQAARSIPVKRARDSVSLVAWTPSPLTPQAASFRRRNGSSHVALTSSGVR